MKPSQVGIRRRPTIRVLTQARDRSVIDDFSSFVAPWRVDHLPYGNFSHVPRDDTINEPCRVMPCNAVLEKRRDVDERDRIPYCVIFVLVMSFIRADGVISRPLA